VGLSTLATLNVTIRGKVCFIAFNRPEANNAIDARMMAEFGQVLQTYANDCNVVVIEGNSEVFCIGADFGAIARERGATGERAPQDPGPLYDLWLQLATGPFVSVAHVRGKANAGGIGFAAACDIVIADEKATFSLSEMLFGLLPACVMPFLVRRIGVPRANYMTLMTHPVDARQAHEWGLVDAYGDQSAQLLRKHLLRLNCLSKKGITRLKRLTHSFGDSLVQCRATAVAANIEVFSDAENLAGITRYVESGLFPWE
jgi:polyketide biosynthesis enoyl-CoA hydratase PksH